MDNTITIHKHGSISFDGPLAVEVLRIATLIQSLKLERDISLKLSRHVSALAIAKRETGLKTRDRSKHIEVLEAKLAALKTLVDYSDESKETLPSLLRPQAG